MRFWKVQGAGNDFVLLDCLAQPEGDWATLAPRLCHRRYGVGADGLLIVLPGGPDGFRMRMFNPDGTEDFCGNGIRCVGHYLRWRGLHNGSALRLGTLVGDRLLRFEPSAEGGPTVVVNMGPPAWNAADIPALAPADPVVDVPLHVAGMRHRLTSLSTGTAHTVIFRDALPDDTLFWAASPAIEVHPWFPERTSVLWCVREGLDSLRLRIWERGVGETLACGTGVCAAAAAAQRKGLVGPCVRVRCPGGSFTVSREGEDLWLRGPAEVVYEGSATLLEGYPHDAGRVR